MKRLGIPRPIFRLQDKMSKLLTRHFNSLLEQILKDFKRQAQAAGVNLSRITADGEMEDNLDDLLNFFGEMKEQEEQARQAGENALLKSQLQSTAGSLEDEWQNTAESLTEPEKEQFEKIMFSNQEDYLNRLNSDASEEMRRLIAGFSVDKRKLYNDNMSALRTLYLDAAIERIADEENYLKKQFLQALVDYVTGKTDTLDVLQVTKALQQDSARMAQFFARDQMQRFNKATTLAQFTAAGVTKVKWVTCHDVRVRESHKALDGQIFPINALPPEVDDYNCRCGLVPAEYAD